MPLLGIYPEEHINEKDIQNLIFIAALFTIHINTAQLIQLIQLINTINTIHINTAQYLDIYI